MVRETQQKEILDSLRKPRSGYEIKNLALFRKHCMVQGTTFSVNLALSEKQLIVFMNPCMVEETIFSFRKQCMVQETTYNHEWLEKNVRNSENPEWLKNLYVFQKSLHG